MSGHQTGGPEPDRERQLGLVQEGAGGGRGLTMATGALEAVGPGLQLPLAVAVAGGAPEAVRPSDGDEPPGAGVVVGEPALEGASHVHHVFPRNYLKKHGLARGRYNQIANYVVMQGEINIAIGDAPPASYFSALWHQSRAGGSSHPN